VTPPAFAERFGEVRRSPKRAGGNTNLESTMIRVSHLFETHLPVRDLDEAIAFYRTVMGLRLAHVAATREAAFFWVGERGTAMLGLWAAGAAPQVVTLHTAFRATLEDVLAAPAKLRASGVVPLDFNGRATDLPVVLAWMPAAAVYFRDPTGHLLEYIAMLPEAPRPDCGVVPWRTWELLRYGGIVVEPPARLQ
jgi:lactoylglutathione lyase